MRKGRGRRPAVRGTSVLQDLLTELAVVLLPRGMTPKKFAELARFAFVRAATRMSRLRNGRVNHSRIAAQTGLSRADVKRLLKSEPYDVAHVDDPPLERVINGWRTDRMFAHRPERPKRLRISGSKVSFLALVRKYGGDVPHRAVLDELRRIGAISGDDNSVSLRSSPMLRRRHDFAFLAPVLPALIDAIRIASDRANSKSASSIHRLTLPVATAVDLAIVQERCVSSARSMIDGLRDSLESRLKLRRKRRDSAYSLAVTVLLVDNGPSNSMQRRRATRPCEVKGSGN
jgi:hypothetical protein